MDTPVYKITINLRKAGTPVVTLATLTPTGHILRRSSVYLDRKDLATNVRRHFESVNKFNAEYIKRGWPYTNLNDVPEVTG